MKKLFATILIISLLVGLTGCACGTPNSPNIIPTETPVITPIVNDYQTGSQDELNPSDNQSLTTPTKVVEPTVEVQPTEIPTPTETVIVEPTNEPVVPTTEPTLEPTETEVPHEHKYEEIERIESTCIEKGKIVYGCECGDTYTEELPLGKHTKGETEIIPATTESDGKVIERCSVCGEIYSIKPIARLIPTDTPTPTATNTPVPTATSTPTNTPTATSTPSPTPTITNVPVPTKPSVTSTPEEAKERWNEIGQSAKDAKIADLIERHPDYKDILLDLSKVKSVEEYETVANSYNVHWTPYRDASDNKHHEYDMEQDMLFGKEYNDYFGVYANRWVYSIYWNCEYKDLVVVAVLEYLDETRTEFLDIRINLADKYQKTTGK